jgi:alanyl-tRNA synthetase
MSENGFPNSSVPSSNPFLSRQNSVFVFPFSVPGITPETSLNHIQSLSEIEPIPQIKQVRNAQNILIIEKQSSIKINRTYNTSTKDSVKIGQLLHENLILKSNNSELLTNFENLKEELLKLTQNLFELKKEKENNEHKIRVYQKNNSELSISLCNSKVSPK